MKAIRQWVPGLRILVWLMLVLVIGATTFALLHNFIAFRFSAFELHLLLPRELVMVLIVFASTFVMATLERRPFDDFGIPICRAFRSTFWEGLLWGFVLLSMVLGILRIAGVFRIDSLALSGRAAWIYAGGWGTYFLAVGFFEEFSFRGYLQFTLSSAWKFWPAAIFLSCAFGASHLFNSGENVLGITQVVIFALLMCLSLQRTGDLWFAIGAHAAWDWAETYFYGVPDSGFSGPGRLLNTSFKGPTWLTGGAAGPEGSLAAILVLGAAIYLLHRRFPAPRTAEPQ